MQLCKTLEPIYKLEISLGNTVKSIDTPAGSKCPFAINLNDKLHFNEIAKQIDLASTVEKWENKDRHYPLQSGYACSKYKHSIAGPT